MAEDAPDMKATGNLERRMKKLEAKIRRLQSRVGGEKSQVQAKVDSLSKRIGKANRFEKFGWIDVPSSWYVGDWGIASLTDTPRYQVMGGFVIVRFYLASSSTDPWALQMDFNLAPSRNLYISTVCGSALNVTGYATIGSGGRVDIHEPYPASSEQTFIHCIYPHEPSTP